MGGAAQKSAETEALLELEAGVDAEFDELPATGTHGGAAALRQVASERLAAHRRKRAAADAQQQALEAEAAALQQQRRGGVSRVREAVAARYSSSVSYHEFLAQEAERALMQAQAEAEVAARNAQAMAEAQMKLLEELEQFKVQPEPVRLAAEEQKAETEARGDFASAMADIVEAATEAMHLKPRLELAPATPGAATPGLTVRLYEDLGPAPAAWNKFSKLGGSSGSRRSIVEQNEHADLEAEDPGHADLDEEIAFRLAPQFDEVLPPEPVQVSGNVIEFPRQLVATRKARPRLAEGPLREDAAGLGEPQLRIFEVEPEQAKAAIEEHAVAPEWQSILLEGGASAQAVDEPVALPAYSLAPQTAPLELRLMALAVDTCAVLAALVAVVCVVIELGGAHVAEMPRALAAVSAVIAAGVFAVAYQMLFFTLSDATPGMRYARIGLCTFGDANPSRKAMRRRVLATLLAACPLGLGLVWAWMDEDRLGWHDRMSRMYQRSY